MSQLMWDDDVRGELIVQISSTETRRFSKRVMLSATALAAHDLGVKASGDVRFALVQDASAVVLFVQRLDFNYGELRFNRSKMGLVPFACVPEKTFGEWFTRSTRSW
jgi:hypothetical protein